MSLGHHFHEVHGNDIKLFNNNTMASRSEIKTNGLIFTSKSIKINEKISLKLTKVSDKLPSIISIGFTTHNPSTLKQNLPKSTRSDLKKRDGFWICSLPKNFSTKKRIVFFYVTTFGNIHYGFDNQEKGIFEKKVEIGGELWALVDIWSPKTTIQILDVDLSNQCLMLHHSCGRNVRLKNNTIKKKNPDMNFSYAFTSRYLQINEKVILKMLTYGHLSIGVTSCNPDDLSIISLPTNPDCLLDRPEYWIVVNDQTWDFKLGDILSYIINPKGEFKIWKNNLLLKIIHVDTTLKLWGFFCLETVQEVEMSVIKLNTDVRPLPPVPYVDTEIWETPSTEEENKKQSSECVICCDKETEVALYPCGHMCMCFECAQTQWRRGGDGLCPICREQIKDVLKIFK